MLKVQAAFTGKRWSSCFKTKDRTKFEHQHDIIYRVKCSAANYPDDYIGELAICWSVITAGNTSSIILGVSEKKYSETLIILKL